MPEPSGYTSHLSIEAVAFVTALPRRKQRIALDLADQIARQPFQIGDYQIADAAGRGQTPTLLLCRSFALKLPLPPPLVSRGRAGNQRGREGRRRRFGDRRGTSSDRHIRPLLIGETLHRQE